MDSVSFDLFWKVISALAAIGGSTAWYALNQLNTHAKEAGIAMQKLWDAHDELRHDSQNFERDMLTKLADIPTKSDLQSLRTELGNMRQEIVGMLMKRG
jgi:cytochrome c556